MANSGYNVREVRFIIEDELTQCYIAMEATGDSPIGVQGWHHKTFPPSKSTLDIMKMWADGEEQPVLWPQEAPPR